MVGPDGELPLPWLEAPLRAALSRQGHALLLHGPEGVGQFELALTLAQALLCEAAGKPVSAAPTGDEWPRPPVSAELPRPSAGAHGVALGAGPRPERRGLPCGTCAACRLVQARSHPDLRVLVPDALREALGWAGTDAEEGAADREKASKAKPSREIKVEAVRAAVVFAQTTASRGQGKVVVLHPAERINAIASNALLKTLEEPPGNARFVLSCARPEALLPTIRSRCQALRLEVPPARQAGDWLAARGIAQPAVLLAACGGQPLQVVQWAADGVEAALWARLPELVLRGDATALQSWPVPRLVEALQKLCHDAICAVAGAPPRYFPEGSIRTSARLEALTAWAQRLARSARRAEHPWNAGLATEALVDDARRTLVSAPPRPSRPRNPSIHSRP